MTHRGFLSLSSVLLLTVACTAPVIGQTQRGTVETLLDIDIMLPQIAGDPLQGQRWRQAFETLGEGVRLRLSLPGDKPSLEESTRGNFRVVKVVGVMDREGKVTFPHNRTFTLAQTEQLRKWLNELKLFGAQGDPDGKPLWGLSEGQFEGLIKQIGGTVTEELRGLDLKSAVGKLPLPAALPLQFHAEAESLIATASGKTLPIEVQGLSAGTALSAILSQWKLGFRPLRDPRGDIRLLVQPLEGLKDPWPIGWPADDTLPRSRIVPQFFELVMSGFDEVPLSRVLDAVEAETDVPIIVNRAWCLERKIDVDKVLVSYPRKQTAYSLVVQSVVRGARLTYEYRLDEANAPFVYVYPFVPYVPAK